MLLHSLWFQKKRLSPIDDFICNNHGKGEQHLIEKRLLPFLITASTKSAIGEQRTVTNLFFSDTPNTRLGGKGRTSVSPYRGERS